MKRYHTIQKILFIVALLPTLIPAGCMQDNDAPAPDSNAKTAVIEITVPGFATPATRSIEDDRGEAAVHTLDLLIFDRSVPARLIRHVKVADFNRQGSAPDYKIEYPLNLSKDDNAGSIVAIANASQVVDAALPPNPAGLQKQVLLEALKFTSSPDAQGAYKWNVATPGYTPVPMYGEAAVNDISAGSRISLTMIRMLARIDLETRVGRSTFDLQEVYLVNYHTQGYIAPAWNPSTGALYKAGDPGYPYATNQDPRIPATAGQPANTSQAAMKYSYNAARGPLVGQIYAYEEPKSSSASNPARGICLILKGHYQGADYFYRVDFTTLPATPQAEYMPLYRNHRYVVTITAAEGIGYSSFDEALRSSTVLSNLKTSLLVVDLAGINDIVFDGQYFMGMKSRTIDLPWGAKRTLSHRVSSDYTGDWQAVVLDPNGHSWLRFAGNNTSVGGRDINRTGLDLVITAYSSPVSGNDEVNGRIVITAGRLRDTLTVRRIPITDLFARSNIVLRSDALNFAATTEENRTMPAHSQGVFFKWGSLLAVAPAGNPYDPEKHVIRNPTDLDPSEWGGGMAGWDKIPYAHPNFGFPAASTFDDDTDAFKEYGNKTGFDEKAGVGDICRYISSQKNWGKGNWRLPTYAELDMLYEETKMKTAKLGTYANVTRFMNEATDRNGDFNPQSGWFLGYETSSSTPTDGHAITPPAGTAYLPAAGQRYPDGDGAVVHVGAYAYYWSSTPYSPYTVNYLFQSKYGIEFYEADHSYAFPIRCIRDY